MDAEPPPGAPVQASTLAALRTRVSAFTPGLSVLAGYQRSWLRGDLIAGATVWAYMVPQVLAYSGLVGLPPSAGLAASIAAALAYLVMGTSRVLSIGPESTVALVAGLLLAPLVAEHPGQATAYTATLTLIVGGWLALARLARLGFLSNMLSRPILVGYLTGGALLMTSSQLGKATATSSSGDTVIDQIADFAAHTGAINWPTVALTTVTCALLFILPRLSPRLPAALITIAAATIASSVLTLDQHGIATLGELPRGLPQFAAPVLDLEVLQALLLGGLAVAVVAYSDVMLTARAFAKAGQPVDANAELAALSGVHLATAAVAGYPVSASSSRTAIGAAAGARSQGHALVVVAGLLSVLLFAGPLFTHLPLASLAAVVIWAASRLVDRREYRRMWRFRRSEFALAAATAAGTAVLGVLPGIGVAIVLSGVEILARLARPHEAVLGYAPGLAGMHDVDDHDGAVTVPGLLIYRYDAPLFFANADDFRHQVRKALDGQDAPIRWLVFNVEANMHVDYTACQQLRHMIAEYQAEGITVGLARLKQDLRSQLDEGGVLSRIDPGMIFDTLPAVVVAYLQAHPQVDPPPLPGPGEPFQPHPVDDAAADPAAADGQDDPGRPSRD